VTNSSSSCYIIQNDDLADMSVREIYKYLKDVGVGLVGEDFQIGDNCIATKTKDRGKLRELLRKCCADSSIIDNCVEGDVCVFSIDNGIPWELEEYLEETLDATRFYFG